MKNHIKIIVFSILLAAIFSGATLLAQNSEKSGSSKKAQQEKAKKEKDRDKAEKKRATKETEESTERQSEKIKSEAAKSESAIKEKSKKQKEEHPGEGAAYGKNKGELSGREFGQWRSEEARAKVRTKVEEVEVQVTKSEAVLKESRTRLEAAKFELARKEKAGGFSSEQELMKRKEKIQAAEEKVKQLEAAIEKEKTVLRQMKDEITDQAAEAQERQE